VHAHVGKKSLPNWQAFLLSRLRTMVLLVKTEKRFVKTDLPLAELEPPGKPRLAQSMLCGQLRWPVWGILPLVEVK